MAGVLAALQHETPLVYGADADHIQVKRADTGLARARRVVDAARYYTFFTLDVADVLSYDAINQEGSGEELLRQRIPDAEGKAGRAVFPQERAGRPAPVARQ